MDNKAFKIGIISGVISSLIVLLLIQPILSFIWNAVIAVGGALHQGYVDRIYRNAAAADRNLIGHITFIFLVLGTICSFWVFTSRLVTLRTPLERTISGLFNILIFVLAGITVLVVLVAFSLSAGIMEITASFNQRLTVMAPAITDAEYKTFRARWASMRSRNDYNALARSKELGVTLPPVREP